MTQRKLLSAFKKKGITPLNIEYVRNTPTPSGYAAGWDIKLSEEDAIKFDEDEFNEFDSANDVFEWIKKLEFDIEEAFRQWFLSLPLTNESLLNDLCHESGEYMDDDINAMHHSFKSGFLALKKLQEQTA